MLLEILYLNMKRCYFCFLSGWLAAFGSSFSPMQIDAFILKNRYLVALPHSRYIDVARFVCKKDDTVCGGKTRLSLAVSLT